MLWHWVNEKHALAFGRPHLPDASSQLKLRHWSSAVHAPPFSTGWLQCCVPSQCPDSRSTADVATREHRFQPVGAAIGSTFVIMGGETYIPDVGTQISSTAELLDTREPWSSYTDATIGDVYRAQALAFDGAMWIVGGCSPTCACSTGALRRVTIR